MIRMTYAHAQALSQNRELLMKLYTTQMSVKTAKKMKRILERVGLAARYVEEQQYGFQMEAAKQFGLLDENGTPRINETGEMQFESDAKKREANQYVGSRMPEVLKKELILVLDPLNLDDTNMKLTLAEIHELGPILSSDEEDSEEPTSATQSG